MNLKLITGVNNSGVISKAFDELANLSRDENKNFIVIVPEKFCMSVERQILKKLNKRAFTNIQVVTLSRMLKKMVTSDDGYLSSEAGTMVVKKIILDHINELVCFKKTARTHGFAKEMFDTISQLKNSDVKPEDYEKIANSPESSLNIKLIDIFKIYSEYENFIRDRYIDASDRFILLSKLIRESDYIKNSDIYVAGYSSMSRSGLEVLKSIIESSKSVTVACVDLSSQNNSYAFESEMLYSVRGIAEELNIRPVITRFNTEENGFIDHISKNLFSYPYSKMKIKSGVEFFEADSPKEEIGEIAKRILKLVYNGNRFNTIGVAVTNIDAYENIILDTFNDYGISCFIDKQDNLSSHPLTEFIMSAFQVVKKNYSADEFLIFVKNYFANLSSMEIAIFDNYITKYGISYNDFKKPFSISAEKNSEYEMVAESVRKKIIGLFSRFESKAISSKIAEDFSDALKLLFEDFDVFNNLDKLADTQNSYLDYKAANATTQVYEKFNEIIENLTNILKSTAISLDEYVSLLASGIAATKISFIPLKVDSVFVGSTSESKFFNTDYLFVAGATEGALPKVKDDCGIIVDREIEIMSDLAKKKIEPTIKTINKRERFKIFELLQSATKNICLSYPKFGFDGEENRAASTLIDFKKIFLTEDGKEFEIETKESYKQKYAYLSEADKAKEIAFCYPTRIVAEKELVKSVRDYRDNKAIDKNAMMSLYDVISSDVTSSFVRAIENINNDNKDYNVSLGSKLFFSHGKTSVSELESYFACPFKHFIDYGLRVKKREDSKIEALDIGNIMHKIAEEYVLVLTKNKNLNNGDAKKRALKLIDSILEAERLSFASNKYLAKPLRNEAIRMCDALYNQITSSNFIPTGEEVEFGKNKKYDGINLFDGVNIEGKIDRIDECGNYARVIDYKTGAIDLSAKETYYGRKVQLFAYLKAVESSKKRLVGAFYLPIKNKFISEVKGENYLSTYRLQGYFDDSEDIVKNMDTNLSFEHPVSNNINISISTSKENIEKNNFVLSRGNKKFVLQEADLKLVTDYVIDICRVAAYEIVSGFIKPSPIMDGNKIVCDYCDYKYNCGFNKDRDNPRKMSTDIDFSDFIKGNNNED